MTMNQTTMPEKIAATQLAFHDTVDKLPNEQKLLVLTATASVFQLLMAMREGGIELPVLGAITTFVKDQFDNGIEFHATFKDDPEGRERVLAEAAFLAGIDKGQPSMMMHTTEPIIETTEAALMAQLADHAAAEQAALDTFLAPFTVEQRVAVMGLLVDISHALTEAAADGMPADAISQALEFMLQSNKRSWARAHQLAGVQPLVQMHSFQDAALNFMLEETNTIEEFKASLPEAERVMATQIAALLHNIAQTTAGSRQLTPATLVRVFEFVAAQQKRALALAEANFAEVGA
jgi:hypothetical protein